MINKQLLKKLNLKFYKLKELFYKIKELNLKNNIIFNFSLKLKTLNRKIYNIYN